MGPRMFQSGSTGSGHSQKVLEMRKISVKLGRGFRNRLRMITRFQDQEGSEACAGLERSGQISLAVGNCKWDYAP